MSTPTPTPQWLKPLIITVVIGLIIAVIIYIRVYKKEKFTYPPTPTKLLVTKLGKSYTTTLFRFKMWDDSKWVAKIIDGRFHIRQRGSNDVHIVSTINVLRFRSMQWQVTLNNAHTKFLVFRLAGLVGTLFQTLDLVDWDDKTYNVRII